MSQINLPKFMSKIKDIHIDFLSLTFNRELCMCSSHSTTLLNLWYALIKIMLLTQNLTLYIVFMKILLFYYSTSCVHRNPCYSHRFLIVNFILNFDPLTSVHQPSSLTSTLLYVFTRKTFYRSLGLDGSNDRSRV